MSNMFVDDEALAEISPMAAIMQRQNKLSFEEHQPSFKLLKVDRVSDRALENVLEANPAIVKERGLFVQVFEKAASKGTENPIQANQHALRSAMSLKGKIETGVEMAKIALKVDLNEVHLFCQRLIAAGCTGDLTKTGKSLLIFKLNQITNSIFHPR